MRDPTILVAFASRSGSTAGIAALIAAELRASGFAVDCRAASEVGDPASYAAIVLGSGLYVRSRHVDGGGFLARHAVWVARRPVWLFCAGPIGLEGVPDTEAPVEAPLIDVAVAIGARGAAAFGVLHPGLDHDPAAANVDPVRVRAWAQAIASELRHRPLATS